MSKKLESTIKSDDKNFVPGDPMILIIAEKPSVAKTIASVVGASNKKKGYFEGNGYYVTNVFGHMFNLYDVSDYDPEIKNWNLVDYPFLPTKFNYKINNNKGIKEQVTIIKELLKNSKSVINATDADREGSLIFYELKEMLDINIPIKRLWVHTQTEDKIREVIFNLNEEEPNLIASGIVRQHIDWYMGINLTTLYTIKSKSRVPIKIGRVILPTLNLIYQREQEILKFKDSTSYSLFMDFVDQNEKITLQYYKDEQVQFDDKDKLESLGKNCLNKDGRITDIKIEHTSKSPDKLFSLTDIQGYITEKQNGFTSKLVLETLQSLYEKGLTTYPRTESRYLQSSMEDEIKVILEELKKNYNLDADISIINFHNKKTVFNDELVQGHYALIPTGKIDVLHGNEKIVYDIIVQRFLCCFMPKAKFEEYILEMLLDEHTFKIKGKNIINQGYLSIHKHQYKETLDLTSYAPGQILKSDAFNVRDIKKKPPKLYTEKTLLNAMLNCGKTVEDEETILQGFTIGTASTRAETIEKMKENLYITQKGKSFSMSQFGRDIISNFPAKAFLNVDFTGKIEKRLKDIETGKVDHISVENEVIEFTKKQFDKLINGTVKEFESQKREVLGLCPLCKGDIVENSKAYSCLNTIENGCTMTLWKEDNYLKAWGIKLTNTKVTTLIEKGSFEATIKSKTEGSKPSKANISIKFDEQKRLSYNIEFSKKKKYKKFKKEY